MKKLLRTNLILTAIVAVIAFSSFAFAEKEEDLYHSPHPIYCNVFYVIEEWGGGIMGIIICPDQLCFNPETGWCDWPEYAHSSDEELGRTHNPCDPYDPYLELW